MSKRYHIETVCHWCAKPMETRKDAFERMMKKYGHINCKRCFGKEPSFRAARKRVMLNNNPFLGKTHSLETRGVLRLKATGRPSPFKGTGKKKKPVIPGSINRWMEFKRTILDRDCNRCLKCETNDRLEVHHIESKKRFPEKHYDESNCIVLCYWCHKAFHKKYTIKKFSRGDTYAFINEGRSFEDRFSAC